MVAYEHVLCMFKHAEDRSSDTSLISQIVAGGIAGKFCVLNSVMDKNLKIYIKLLTRFMKLSGKWLAPTGFCFAVGNFFFFP